jgi:hypothetical protein
MDRSVKERETMASSVLRPLALAVLVAMFCISPPSRGASGDVLVGAGMPDVQPGSGGQFTISARSDADGGSPSGTIVLVDTQPRPVEIDRYSVICLRVSGNVATVVGLKESNPSSTDFEVMKVTVTDNAATDEPDQLASLRQSLSENPSLECTPLDTFQPVTSGNFVVSDE